MILLERGLVEKNGDLVMMYVPGVVTPMGSAGIGAIHDLSQRAPCESETDTGRGPLQVLCCSRSFLRRVSRRTLTSSSSVRVTAFS
jgi:hypothetical protein